MKAAQDIIIKPIITEESMTGIMMKKYSKLPKMPARLRSRRLLRNCSPAPR